GTATFAILDFRLPIANNRNVHRGHLAVARRKPRKTKSAPAVRLSHCETFSLLRNRVLNVDANQARTKNQIFPLGTNESPRVTKVSTSVRNAAIFMLDAGSINCGRKARKNNATFGLITFVKTP